MNLEDALLQGLRADQPSASSVVEGSLYFVTDEEVTEQQFGGVWTPYSSTGSGGGITQLTGNVTAGPGSGSQAATIANDAVTNAKLANVNTQTIKGRTTASSGDPEDLTATQATAVLNALVGDSGSGGTKGLAPAPAAGDAAAGKFLKADGTWVAPSGGGGLVLLNTQTVTNAASLDFTSVITSTYDEYLIEILNLIPLTNTADPWVRVSTDNGSTFEVTNYAWIKDLNSTTANVGSFGNASDSKISFGVDLDSSSISRCNGSFKLFNPLSASFEKSIRGNAVMFQQSTGLRIQSDFSGWWTQATAINALRIMMSTGNITVTARIYGITK